MTMIVPSADTLKMTWMLWYQVSIAHHFTHPHSLLARQNPHKMPTADTLEMTCCMSDVMIWM